MDGVAILIGLLVRVGVPIAMTALMAWWLKRLDARWQREAEAVRARLVERAGRPVVVVPCWEIRGCPPERRASCPAFAHPGTPCWQIFRNARGELREGCLDCDVFRAAPALA